VPGAQDARKVVGVWEAEFLRAPAAPKKLALLYLANDILQNSRKKGPEYVQEFFRALPRPLQQLLKHGDGKARPPPPPGAPAGRVPGGPRAAQGRGAGSPGTRPRRCCEQAGVLQLPRWRACRRQEPRGAARAASGGHG